MKKAREHQQAFYHQCLKLQHIRPSLQTRILKLASNLQRTTRTHNKEHASTAFARSSAPPSRTPSPLPHTTNRTTGAQHAPLRSRHRARSTTRHRRHSSQRHKRASRSTRSHRHRSRQHRRTKRTSKSHHSRQARSHSRSLKFKIEISPIQTQSACQERQTEEAWTPLLLPYTCTYHKPSVTAGRIHAPTVHRPHTHAHHRTAHHSLFLVTTSALQRRQVTTSLHFKTARHLLIHTRTVLLPNNIQQNTHHPHHHHHNPHHHQNTHPPPIRPQRLTTTSTQSPKHQPLSLHPPQQPLGGWNTAKAIHAPALKQKADRTF